MRITITIEDGEAVVTSSPSTSDTPKPPAEILAAAAAIGAIDGGPAPASVPMASAVSSTEVAEAPQNAPDTNAISAGPAPGTQLEAAPDTVEETTE